MDEEPHLIVRLNEVKSQHEDSVTWSRSERQHWLIQLTIGTCILFASRLSVPLVSPAMAAENFWTKTEAGSVLSSFFWGYLITQVIGGFLSDKVGGERVLVFSTLGWSLCTLAMPHVVRCYRHPTSLAILGLRVLHGACQGFHYPALSSLSSRRLSEYERGPFFSISTVGAAVGAVLAGSAGSALLSKYDWSSIFKVIGACGIAWALILSIMTISRPTKTTTKALDTSIKSAEENLPLAPSASMEDTTHWAFILCTKAFWSCAIAHACQNNCFYIMLSWLPTYFHDMKFAGGKDWVFNVVPWACLIPATFLGRILSERLLDNGYSVTHTRKIVESVCLLSQALGLILICYFRILNSNSSAYTETFTGAVVCSTLVIAASAFHNNAVIINPQDLAPHHAGSVFGLMNTVGAVPGFLGVYFAGHLLEVYQSWDAVFFATASLNIFGCVIFIIFGCGDRII